MRKIDELIAQHCPNGVKYEPILNIGILYGGLTGKTRSDFNDGHAKYIPYKNIFSNIAVNTNTLDLVKIDKNEKQNEVKIGDVLFTGSSENAEECGMSSVLTQKNNEKMYLNSFCFGLRLNDKKMFLPSFLKYLFRDTNVRKEIIKTANGVTRFNISKKSFVKIKIPIPPLEVQEEIVKILDTFTKLEAELEAELETRQQQYSHYRDELLNFCENRLHNHPLENSISQHCPNGVKYEPILNIGILYGGLTGKTRSDFNDGHAKYIPYKNIFSNIAVNTNTLDLVKIGKNEKQNEVKIGDVLFTGSSENAEECGMSSVLTQKNNEKMYLNSFCFGLRLNDQKMFLPSFSKYLFRDTNVRKEIIKTANGVTRFNISKKSFVKIKIPIPPLEVQEEIVKILDKFDELVNDISSGLPAEITARRQQYEHYRNQLLTFKEVL